MDKNATTEAVVRNHLDTFIKQKGVAAIVADYAPSARLYTPKAVFDGPREISRFFTAFLDSLPQGGYERFRLDSLRVDGELAFITWSVGADIPLGADTFVVRDGRIVAQTVAVHVAPAATTQ
jgi:hypothetical protein